MFKNNQRDKFNIWVVILFFAPMDKIESTLSQSVSCVDSIGQINYVHWYRFDQNWNSCFNVIRQTLEHFHEFLEPHGILFFALQFCVRFKRSYIFAATSHYNHFWSCTKIDSKIIHQIFFRFDGYGMLVIIGVRPKEVLVVWSRVGKEHCHSLEHFKALAPTSFELETQDNSNVCIDYLVLVYC